MSRQIDTFTAERIIEAATSGDSAEGFEQLGELLTAFHEPATDAEALGTPPFRSGTGRRGLVGRLTRRSAVVGTAAALAVTGVAAALTATPLLDPLVGGDEPAPGEETTEANDAADSDDDTVLNFAYDEPRHLFVWNISDLGSTDCVLENGGIDATYGVEDDAVVVSTELDDACPLSVAEISGPNGQINHGQFMKFFNSIYEGAGRGCLVRHLAGSDLGKGDQQLRTGEFDPDFESVSDGDTGELDFRSFTADCDRGGSQNAENGENGQGHGRGPKPAEERGKPDSETGRPESPGRSDDAPGRNK